MQLRPKELTTNINAAISSALISVRDGYGTIVEACCDAWNKLMKAPERIASITRRTWATAASG
jgi:hypothetical protein